MGFRTPRRSLTLKRAYASPYQRIVRAAERGVGLRLSAAEVAVLDADSAIHMVADNEDTEVKIVYDRINTDRAQLALLARTRQEKPDDAD